MIMNSQSVGSQRIGEISLVPSYLFYNLFGLRRLEGPKQFDLCGCQWLRGVQVKFVQRS
jgi:hypothetical protein